MPNPKIVISYRRTDSDAAGRIFDLLAQRYGNESVFQDIESIPVGIDFRRVIDDALRRTDLLIVVIGPDWLGIRKDGSAKINDTHDFVRIEIETALQREIPIVPVLVKGAGMPDPFALPESVRGFAHREPVKIGSGLNFDFGIEPLIREMDRLFDVGKFRVSPEHQIRLSLDKAQTEVRVEEHQRGNQPMHRLDEVSKEPKLDEKVVSGVRSNEQHAKTEIRHQPKVFISYRRDESKYQAKRMHDAFVKALPLGYVFMDIDSVPLGADFVDILEGWVKKCDILLALIGLHWSDVTDPKTNMRRLDNSNDFVRIEIREALRRGISVIPILLDSALMPHPENLPEDIRDLVRRQAAFVEFRTFDTDVRRLIRKLGIKRERRKQA